MAETNLYDTDFDDEGEFLDAVDYRQIALPTELLQAILSHAGDAFSLKNLAQCCSSFHRAFLANQDFLLQTVLRNEISAGVLPDALVTFASARLLRGEEFTTIPSDGHLRQGFDCQAQLRQLVKLGLISWSVPKALALSQLHSHIVFFTHKFASTLVTNPITGSSNQNPVVLRPKELERIERSFYRYELFCNLSRAGSQGEDREFLEKFAPWENEQLATIYDFLYDQMSIAFDEIAQHDVQWGESLVNWLDGKNGARTGYKGYPLSLGLGYLRQLVTASTYEERYKLLQLKCYSGGLADVLSIDCDQSDDLPLSGLTPQQKAHYISLPHYEDPDIGPAEAWQWAYQGETTSAQYFMPPQRQLRQLGYVMYDYDRLSKWPEFQEPFNPSAYEEDPDVKERNYQKMQDSWEKRSQWWQKGARGYWSEEDSSKLVFPYNKPKVPPIKLDKWGFPPPGVSASVGGYSAAMRRAQV